MITLISYRYRHGMLQGTDEFAASLKENYPIYSRSIWMPAGGGNFEMWFDFFVNSNVIDFLKDAIIGNAVYDLTKHLFKPFIDSLNHLQDANEYPLEIQEYTFYFEDTVIVIYGLTENFAAIFSEIFSELFKQYPTLKASLGNIHEIRIPVDRETGDNPWFVGTGDINSYLTYWRISINHGVDYHIWDVQNRQALP